jgi:hypothetical protein
MGGVRRAVVKIYHGRKRDRRGHLWRTPQKEADKKERRPAFLAVAVT